MQLARAWLHHPAWCEVHNTIVLCTRPAHFSERSWYYPVKNITNVLKNIKIMKKPCFILPPDSKKHQKTWKIMQQIWKSLKQTLKNMKIMKKNRFKRILALKNSIFFMILYFFIMFFMNFVITLFNKSSLRFFTHCIIC